MTVHSPRAEPHPSSRHFYRFSLKQIFTTMLIILVLMAAANVAIVQIILTRFDTVAETINVAGRLRMLSQKVAFEQSASLRQSNTDGGIAATLDAYERDLAALEHGNQVIPGLPIGMRPLAMALRRDWTAYRAHAQRLYGNHDASPEQLDALAAESTRLLDNAETLVTTLTLDDQRARARMQLQLSGLFLAELLIFATLVFIVRRRILTPLRELTRHHRQLAAGHYESRMPISSSDEMGDLASAFNFASRTIAELMLRNARDNDTLQQTATMFQELAENAIVGVYIVQDEAFLFANQRMADMFGYDREQITATVGLLDIIDEKDHEVVKAQIEKRLSGEMHTVIYEVRGCKSNGARIDLEIYGSVMELNGRLATVGAMLDVTQRNLAQNQERRDYVERLQYQASHDELTGLANRKLFSDCLYHATAMARRFGNLVAVLLLDLDQFKIINDSLGHPVGDDLLRAVADRLRTLMRETDTVARLGGDEFVVLLPNITAPGEAAHVAQKILDALAAPFLIQNREIQVSVSTGISLYPQDGEEYELLKNADLAMYKAKQAGGNKSQFYSTELGSHNRRHMELVTELRHALGRNELTLAYQPKWDLYTQQIKGAEALLRWQHPRLGNISPTEFIPLAEETGLIIPIGEWVMHTACAQNRAWQDAGLPAFAISINLSARQFQGDDLIELVNRVLEHTGLDGKYLDLELTESALVQNLDSTAVVLASLKKAGVELSMDDFGTGYSSLSYLMRLPFDTLKLDRSFISDLATRANARTLTLSIITLAHNLGLKVVAEGIETQEQLGFLQDSGCDQGQGYYFSPPLPADGFFQHAMYRMSPSGLAHAGPVTP